MEDISKLNFVIKVASHQGDTTLNLSLNDTVDRLINYIKDSKMWVTINGIFFNKSALFNGSAEDEVAVNSDKQRLKNLLLSYVRFPENAEPEVPSIAVTGRLVGGKI